MFLNVLDVIVCLVARKKSSGGLLDVEETHQVAPTTEELVATTFPSFEVPEGKGFDTLEDLRSTIESGEKQLEAAEDRLKELTPPASAFSSRQRLLPPAGSMRPIESTRTVGDYVNAATSAKSSVQQASALLLKRSEALETLVRQFKPIDFGKEYIAALELHILRNKSDDYRRLHQELEQSVPRSKRAAWAESYADRFQEYANALRPYAIGLRQYHAALQQVLQLLENPEINPGGSSSTQTVLEPTVPRVSPEPPEPRGKPPEPTSRKKKGPREIEIDGKKYVSLPTAAKMLSVTHGTLHGWATKNIAVYAGRPISVVKDPVSRHRFISLDEVELLKHRFEPLHAAPNTTRESLPPPTKGAPAGTLIKHRRSKPRGR